MKKALPIIALIAIAGIATYFLFSKTHTEYDMSQVKSDLSISAVELYTSFREDESAANEKFLNKTIVVEGEVIDIGKGRNGMPRLRLFGNGNSFAVLCDLDKESKPKRLEFHKGENVRLKCICMDYYNDVQLTNCVEE